MAAKNPLLVRLVTSLTCDDWFVPVAHQVRRQRARDIRSVTDGAVWRATGPVLRH
jgi:hypothetical protein